MAESNGQSAEKKYKRPAWTRTLDVILRTAHVAVTSILFGAAVYGVPYPLLIQWQHLTIWTGCGLVASEFYHSYHWPYQGRGIMVYIHVGLLGVIHIHPELTAPVMAAALVFGMVGSHMPKKYRYWSFVHKRVVQ